MGMSFAWRRSIYCFILWFSIIVQNTALFWAALQNEGELGVTSHTETMEKCLNIDSGSERDTFISLSPQVKAEPWLFALPLFCWSWLIPCNNLSVETIFWQTLNNRKKQMGFFYFQVCFEITAFETVAAVLTHRIKSLSIVWKVLHLYDTKRHTFIFWTQC